MKIGKSSVQKTEKYPLFEKLWDICESGLYSVRKTTILEKENIVDMNVPQWLLNSMCAIWNSGIKVIYAKDRMGDDNYPNAYWHGMNSCIISEYLPKLVNE